ncbi:DUF4214 domain-containing protein [Massilia sp. W12]|uniref:DUF4214 domain-containing protein n=1 Tax=Massilia sp. W12 TaxID=3126507 RepID=UPI0030D1D490
MATVTDVTTAHTSGLNHIDALIDTGPAWNYVLPGNNNILKFSFSINSGKEDPTYALSAFSASQQNATRSMLSYVSSVTGIQFQEVSDASVADWRFSMRDIEESSVAGLCSWNTSYNYDGNQQITEYSAQAWIYLDNVEWNSANQNLIAGEAGYETLLHEIGHALGLKHPFQGGTRLPANQDNTSNTLMSYTDSGGPYSTFRPYDVAALNWLYGGDGLAGKLGVGGNAVYLIGSASADTLSGSAGNDVFTGLAGNDAINGAAGLDLATYSLARSNFTISKNGSVITVTDNTGALGVDTLNGVERLRFADKYVNFDTDGASGKVYRLYQAAFDRTPDAGGLGFWFHQMENNGSTLTQIAQGFMGSAEFQAMYGSNPSAETVVGLLYNHVLHRQAEPDGYNFWVNVIKQGNPVADVLAYFADSPENQAQVIGTIQNGMEFSVFSG